MMATFENTFYSAAGNQARVTMMNQSGTYDYLSRFSGHKAALW
ncbi:MAG: hypothetical protein RQM92_05150 [Candidatus Syntrophopropionicum ammoniitolerans]